MTATYRHMREPALTTASFLRAKVATMKRVMTGLWPPAMIAFGFALTLAWSGALLWLFVYLILDVT
jgi:hypothetical protein